MLVKPYAHPMEPVSVYEAKTHLSRDPVFADHGIPLIRA